VVQETRTDAYAAIDLASERIGRTVDRLIDRASVRHAVSRAARSDPSPD
jgi:ribosome-associated translation inhibitor RaiA